jgi:hypothetical protein
MFPVGIQIGYTDPMEDVLEKFSELRQHNIKMKSCELIGLQRIERYEYTCEDCGTFFCIEKIPWPHIGDYIISAGEYDCYGELGYLNHRPLQGIPNCAEAVMRRVLK